MIPRFIHSGMAGAPAIAQAVSGGLSVLNAALVDGFNVTSPASVTVSGGVATFSYLAPHGYADKCWLRVSGAGAAVLNADLQCTVPNATTFTVPAPGVPDGPVSGTIGVKVAPLGWERPFTAANIAVYRSPNIAGTRMYYQADDSNVSGSQILRLRGFESMTSATVGVDPFPTVAQLGPGVGLVKGAGTPWAVIGDDRTVYIYTGSLPQGANYHGVVALGDILSYKPADAFGALLSATNTSNGGQDLAFFDGTALHYLARAANAIQKSPFVGCVGPTPGQSGRTRPYPSVVSGGATFTRGLHLLDGSGSAAVVRGEHRGLMYVHEAIPASPWVVVPTVTGISGRVVVLGSGAGSVALPVDEEWA